MLDSKVMQILENGLNEQTAIDYISSRALLEAHGYTIKKRKVYDSEGNYCAYLHQYCYKLGTMVRKAPTKTIAPRKQTSAAELIAQFIELSNKLGERLNVKTGDLKNFISRCEAANKAQIETATIEAEIAKTVEAARIDAQIAALQAKRKAL